VAVSAEAEVLTLCPRLFRRSLEPGGADQGTDHGGGGHGQSSAEGDPGGAPPDGGSTGLGAEPTRTGQAGQRDHDQDGYPQRGGRQEHRKERGQRAEGETDRRVGAGLDRASGVELGEAQLVAGVGGQSVVLGQFDRDLPGGVGTQPALPVDPGEFGELGLRLAGQFPRFAGQVPAFGVALGTD